MAHGSDASRVGTGGHFLSTLGLMLNFAAIIAMALWLSMADGRIRGDATMIAGMLTIVLFAASIVCFAADGPESNEATTTGPRPVLPQ